MKRCTTLIVVAILATTLVGCRGSNPSAPETAFLSPDRDVPTTTPLKLTIGLNEIYCKKTACECVHFIASRSYDSLCAMLRAKHNIELELVYFPEDIYGLERAVAEGRFDAVLAKPWSILQEAGKAGRRFTRVVDLRDPNNNTELRGLIIVKADSPYKTMASLKGLPLAMGQVDAYEKHQAVITTFNRAGLTVPAGDNRLERASCLECVNDLLSQTVNVAVISDYALHADCLVDTGSIDDFRIIARTDESIPLTSLMVDTAKMSPDKIIRLRRALLDCSGDNAPKEMQSKGFTMPVPWSPQIPDTAGGANPR